MINFKVPPKNSQIPQKRMNNIVISMERVQKSDFIIKKKVIENNCEIYIIFHLGYLKIWRSLSKFTESDGVKLIKFCPNSLIWTIFFAINRISWIIIAFSNAESSVTFNLFIHVIIPIFFTNFVIFQTEMYHLNSYFLLGDFFLLL